jgi:hypothetical protein
VSERFRCSFASADADEELYATASQVRRWLLLEEPSGWGRDAVLQSRLPPDVAIALRARARSVGARLLLIRRHGRYEAAGRTAFVAVTTSSVQRIERFQLHSAAELLDIDMEPLVAFDEVGGERVEGPLFLVCTNGRHDPCCAELGRPVAQALDAVIGDRVWESSHFGGDRFAGNVVCLPDGVYYGRVSPLNAVRLARDYAAGTLHLEHYRGRSSVPFAVQAAEHFARRQRRLTAVGDMQPLSHAELGQGLVRAEFASRAGRLVVTVQRFDDPEPAQLTCHSTSLVRAPRFRLVAMEEAA